MPSIDVSPLLSVTGYEIACVRTGLLQMERQKLVRRLLRSMISAGQRATEIVGSVDVLHLAFYVLQHRVSGIVGCTTCRCP